MQDDKANRKTDLRRTMKQQTLASLLSSLNEDLYFISDVIGLDKGIS